jgi:hypothetical protein
VLVLAVGLVAAVAAVWVPPALAGPAIDCGDLSQADCDRMVPVAVAEANASFGLGFLMPVTRVGLSGSVDCLSFEVIWLFGVGFFATPLC